MKIIPTLDKLIKELNLLKLRFERLLEDVYAMEKPITDQAVLDRLERLESQMNDIHPDLTPSKEFEGDSNCSFCLEPRPNDWKDIGWMSICIPSTKTYFKCPKCDAAGKNLLDLAIKGQKEKLC